MNASHVPASRRIRIVFIRHAQTLSNAQKRYMGQLDSPLSPQGCEQVAAVAKRLSMQRFPVIYSSDLGRAAETARGISAANHSPLVLDSRLRERHNGIFQGMTFAQAQESFPEIHNATLNPTLETRVPNGECALQVRTRMAGFLDDISLQHGGETVAVVTHGGVLRIMLGYLMNIPLGVARRCPVENTSLSCFSTDGDQWIMEYWNDTGHLSVPR